MMQYSIIIDSPYSLEKEQLFIKQLISNHLYIIIKEKSMQLSKQPLMTSREQILQNSAWELILMIQIYVSYSFQLLKNIVLTIVTTYLFNQNKLHRMINNNPPSAKQTDSKHPQPHLPLHTNNVNANSKNDETNALEVQNLKKPQQTGQVNRIKSKSHKIVLGLITSISAIMLGYSLLEITSIPINTLVTQYHIPMSSSSAQSLLIGILPLGSVVGAIITKFLLQKLMRRTGIYIFTVINCGAIILVNITEFPLLVIGRFIEGILCIGHYSAIAPIYCKEIVPKQLRKLIGLFFSLGKILGVLIAIILQLILDGLNVGISWRIILSMTAPFSLLQAILIFFVGFHTPAELIEKGKNDEALEVIKDHFIDVHVDDIYQQYMAEFQAEAQRGANGGENKIKSQIKIEENKEKKQSLNSNKVESANQLQPHKVQENCNEAKGIKISKQKILKQDQLQIEGKKKIQGLTFEQKRTLAYWVGVHLCWLRHFSGGNVVISQGGLFIKVFNAGLGKYTPLIVNIVQLIFVLFGLVYLPGKIGKRPQFLLSTSLMALLNFALVVSMIFEEVLAMVILMCIYIAIYGGIFISLTWAYPPQVIPAKEALVYNVVHWLGMALSTLIPPLVTGGMPDQNPYPVFIFFGVSSFLGFLHFWRYLRESDNLTFNEIINSYK